jgi:glycosyltransferase involved in cell wall biosynthesis
MKTLCHEADYKYMKEYIDSFLDGELIVYNAQTVFEVDEYFCVRRIPVLPEGCKVRFLNTEQLCVSEKMAEFNATLSSCKLHEIFDYSEANITLSGKGTYLPYKERSEETEKLRKYLDVPKEFDVVVVGTHSERRKAIINSLKSQHLRVDWITDLFGEERDKRIGKSHILLNLHYSDSYQVFESVRCNRWKWAGMRILTEPCTHIPDGISAVELDKLYPKLVKMLGPLRLPKYKIGLSMIVKDESHIIHEVLNASLPFIDTFCILDTGSTDNTVQIIRDFYAEKGIQGEVHQGDWKGFGKSRSEALALCDGKMDYILMIDADDLIEGPPNVKDFLLNALYTTTPNACNIHIRRGTLEYERTQLFKARDGWRYEGVLHEYPTNDKEKNTHVRLPKEIWMTGRTIGARSLIPGNKYQRDAETILEALKEEPNNTRYMFYLAQSYRDAGMVAESVTWYEKRIEAGGWVEEQYVCALNLTRLLNSKEWAWKAHELCPQRSESLVSYISYCRSKGMWSRELLSMCLYASSIKKPEGTFLFLENDTYDWKIWDELSIVSAFCKAFDVSKMAYIRLLKEKKYPPEQDARIRENFKQTLMLAQTN